MNDFLTTTSEHAWAAGFRLAVLYGLRRSELLVLGWDDFSAEEGSIRVDEASWRPTRGRHGPTPRTPDPGG